MLRQPQFIPSTEGVRMGLMPAGSANPFSKMDRQAVLGTLKASGSSDPDVLYAQKEALLAPYKNLKRLAILGGVIGAFFTITMNFELD